MACVKLTIMKTQNGYITIGSVRGWCGHTHKTEETAQACIAKDQAGCVKGCGKNAYTDRRVVQVIDGEAQDDGVCRTNDGAYYMNKG